MQKIREALRLHSEADMTVRQICVSVGASVGTVQSWLSKTRQAHLGWQLALQMSDEELAALIYGDEGRSYRQPDWQWIHQELKIKGVTRQLLFEEYRAQGGKCYHYSRFCDLYSNWLKRQKRSMRQVHKGGEKAFVDYSGKTVLVFDGEQSVWRQAQIFVGVLGASNYTYAEATWSQSLEDWLGSHTRMVEFFGGVPNAIVPDNVKAAVTRSNRYEPQLNRSYQQWAEHYRTAVLPARPRRPKDKAKVENAVLLVQRWIVACLRHRSFTSLDELNQAIRELLVELNLRAFQKLPENRWQAFVRLDQPHLRALPMHRYEYAQIKTVKVNVDYHVTFERHHYSVPCEYVGEQLEVRASQSLLRVYFGMTEIAVHRRQHSYGCSTNEAHMPRRHREHASWTPQRIQGWANTLGPEVSAWVRYQFENKAHPEQAYRVCLGLLSLSRKYAVTRVEKACHIANREGLYTLRSIRSILQNNRDQWQPQLELPQLQLPQQHDNVRGAKHFH